MVNDIFQIRIFIGSSSEAKDVADNLSVILGRKGFFAKTWDNETFQYSDNYFESIKREIVLADYAILIVNPDDKIVKRGEETYTTRDNVWIELGMFIGVLGIKKVFYLSIIDNRYEEKKEVPIPSDFAGIELPKVTRTEFREKFDQDLANICTTIEKRIKRLESEMTRVRIGMLPSESLALGYFNNFLDPVCYELTDGKPIELGARSFDPNNDKFEFNIILPDNLNDVSPRRYRDLFRDQSRFIKVQVGGRSRNFPFYIDSEKTANYFKLYDYPTTLSSSYEAIQRAINQDDYYTDEQKNWLKNREIRNFHRTLKIMLEEKGAIYRNKIKFISEKEFNART